jgi:hypothetical protein
MDIPNQFFTEDLPLTLDKVPLARASVLWERTLPGAFF